MPFRLAFLPYYTLIAVVAAATFIAPLHRFLEGVAITIAFPATLTGLGWRVDPSRFELAPLGHPGALLLYTTVISAVLFKLTGRDLPRWTGVWKGTSAQGVPTTITILALVGVAVVMTHSGMTFLLARGLTAVVGPVFPLVSPFIGLLGTVITGSNTNSNVLFGTLQRDVARLLEMNPVVMAALQSAGGALGSMVAPAKIVLATATTGLAGREGEVLRMTVRYAIALTAALGLLGLLIQFL
jgi:lactate permease